MQAFLKEGLHVMEQKRSLKVKVPHISSLWLKKKKMPVGAGWGWWWRVG